MLLRIDKFKVDYVFFVADDKIKMPQNCFRLKTQCLRK